MYEIFVAGTLDALDAVPYTNINSDFLKFLRQPADQIGIELWQHPLAALKNDDFDPRTRSDVRELRRDVATADHHDAFRQPFQCHELIAKREMFFAGKPQRCGPRAAGDQNMPPFEQVPVHLDGIPAGKASHAVEGIDALLGEALLAFLGDRIGESPFEGDQVFPVYFEFAGRTPVTHPP